MEKEMGKRKKAKKKKKKRKRKVEGIFNNSNSFSLMNFLRNQTENLPPIPVLTPNVTSEDY